MNSRDPRYPIGEWTRPDTISDSDLAAWIERIEALPSKFRSVAESLSEEQLEMHYRPGGWTLRQVVHHVPESHLNGFVRFKWALTEDRPAIKTYDEKGWAETPDIPLLPVAISLDLLEALHVKWVTLIRSLSFEQLRESTFQHPEWNEIDLATMVSLYSWHGDHHLGHITSSISQRGSA